MGRVVKNARFGVGKYHVVVPTASSNGVHHATEEEEANNLAALMEEPAPPPLPVHDLAAEATALIELARTRALALMEDARVRAHAIIDEAQQAGEALHESISAAARVSGHAEGVDAADREMNDMVGTMRNLVAMARAERHKLIETAEPELVKLAIGIAERVLHQQITLDRNIVVEMTKVAISRLVDRESVTVRVNPADVERMKQHRDELLSAGDVPNMRVVEDQRVDRGGVLVETDGGTIDARISTQLHEAKRVLHIEDDVIVQPSDAAEAIVRPARAM